MAKRTFKRGQKVVCTHYKDRPVVRVKSVDGDEVWVLETKPCKNGKVYVLPWWGPKNWFKKVSK